MAVLNEFLVGLLFLSSALSNVVAVPMQYGEAGSFLSPGSRLQSESAVPAQRYSAAGALQGDGIRFTPAALPQRSSSTGTLPNLHEESKGLETIREKEIIVLRHVLKYHCVDVLSRWGMQ